MRNRWGNHPALRTDLNPYVRAAFFLFFGLPVLMLLGGRVTYWQGWVYGGLTALVLAANLYSARRHPQLAAERRKPGGEAKKWDRLYFIVASPMSFAALILSTLDAGRFRWSPAFPARVYVLVYALQLAGQGLFFWAKWTNPFFARVARIQEDRGQRVCDRGPYRLVRHPGYAGGVLYMSTVPLMMGSLWGLIPEALAVAALIWRTRREDRMLREELPGYREYGERVRWRLLPLVW